MEKSKVCRDRPLCLSVIKSLFVILSFVFCLLPFLLGCANIKEIAKGVIGISTKDIEGARPNAIKKDFNLSKDECYDKVVKVLTEIKACVYAKSKDMLAIYVSEEDTTTVGIFFTSIDENNTKIEVSSASTPAKEFIAKKLWTRLEK